MVTIMRVAMINLRVSLSLWISKVFMSLNAKVQTNQVMQTLTMNFGHLLMVDMEIKNVSWVSRLHTSEESKTQNALTVRNWSVKY